MSKTEHTQEPWRYNLRDNDDPVIVAAAPLTIYHDECEGPKEAGCQLVIGEMLAEADAARAVDCVNGCKGIDDPEVTVPELLAACIEQLRIIAECRHATLAEETRLRAAIAKATE